MEEKSVIISNVYDNTAFDPKFKTGFGFSCLIKINNKYILFDTGGDSPTLLANMETLGIKPAQIDVVILSHSHGDHTGGLQGFLEKNPDVAIYKPTSFSKPTKLFENVYTTGALGTGIKEQSLVIDAAKGLIVITGCAHPGIVDIVKTAKRMLNRKIYLVLGGFHLGDATEVIKEFRLLGVEKVAPCHCTGDTAVQQFKEEYEDDFIENGVGKVINI
jgi:7,8-dihydropterin-6-yl-methyl-4-(beta-D-ribofuranosyl)aminobenzene 5'-phosphate synthase